MNLSLVFSINFDQILVIKFDVFMGSWHKDFAPSKLIF